MQGKSSAGLRAVVLIVLVAIFSFDIANAQESNASRERRAGSAPAAEATVTVNEQFLNAFLTAIFDNLQEPAMPLTIGNAAPSAQCPSEIKLKREVGGVRTAVHFEDGRIVGP